MIIIETHEYRFPSYLLPALINNEPVDEIDRDHFNAFLDELEKHKKEYGASHYTIDYESDSYFSYNNCLNNLGCDITEIRVHFIR